MAKMLMRKIDSRRFRIMLLAVGCIVVTFPFSRIYAQSLQKEIPFAEHKFIPCYALKKAGNTSIFQGNKKKKEYFEGWYFKMVGKEGNSIISVIPGISLSSDGEEQHAFIQIINGVSAQTYYYSFPVEDFFFSKKDFAVRIGGNYFSRDSLVLNIQQGDETVSGRVLISDPVSYRSGRLFNTGIMGWYRFVPFMECYHGVVSLSHGLEGSLRINGDEFNFTEGRGYIEKDWGSSMPSAWIWMQSNNFAEENSSFMLSIANIPWLGKSFTGFLGFFYHNNEIYHFATYRPTRLFLEITDQQHLDIRIENRKNTFLIQAVSNSTGLLKAPVGGAMDRRIPESIDAAINITMLDKEGNIVFQDSTNIAGLEMVGDFEAFEGMLK